MSLANVIYYAYYGIHLIVQQKFQKELPKGNVSFHSCNKQNQNQLDSNMKYKAINLRSEKFKMD